jgi:hypothetical protein
MVFVEPWLLLALVALPMLWWLLRVTPPTPRTEAFPAIRLLAGLRANEETPAHTPLWLLALRLLAAGLVVVGLARPVLRAGAELPGSGPVLLVLDDGWAAAADWQQRLAAAETVLDRAERAGRPVALLGLAHSETDAAPTLSPVMPVADLRPRLAALRPKPWPDDRVAAAAALGAWQQADTAVVYLPDGLARDGDAALASAMERIGPVAEIRAAASAARLVLAPRAEADRLILRLAQTPQPHATDANILAQTGDGRTLARVGITVPAGATNGEAALQLPPELRNQLAQLVLAGVPSAGGVMMLDESWRRRPVGLVAGDATTADTPLSGQLYYLRQALGPTTELREGDIATLLSRDIAVIVLADRPVTDPHERDALAAWVRRGGLLLRFAGPRTAEISADMAENGAATGVPEQPTDGLNGGRPEIGAAPDSDALLPVRLLAGDRQMGGAMSWSKPAGLAPFLADSPFNGLPVPPEVTVTEQVLAEPNADLAAHSWATLADGTPLVTATSLGAGRIVLFHTTANADWSNLPLSGLFVQMMQRLVQLSAGVATPANDTLLAPAVALDGFGQPSAPPPAATALPASQVARTAASPRHPPGLYGPENGRQALNLATGIGPLVVGAPVAGARQEALDATLREQALGPWLLAAAVALLAIDLLLALSLRGLLRPTSLRRATVSLVVLAGLGLASLGLATPAQAQSAVPPDFPALLTRLAYLVTGDRAVDSTSQAGLAGLSDYVNRRTNANLGAPAAVQPGRDDLSFYPLLYWPVVAQGTPDPGMIAALNDYMGHGGIVLIDTRGDDSALAQAARGLEVPRLVQLSSDHVLARSFYLLDSFPGRTADAPVWVQRDQDRSNDSVSPVIIGANNWASAWAVDAAGRPAGPDLPGGARQRTLAYRFGVNLVMYALTGNYKGDQVHVPAILERLGQ